MTKILTKKMKMAKILTKKMKMAKILTKIKSHAMRGAPLRTWAPGVIWSIRFKTKQQVKIKFV